MRHSRLWKSRPGSFEAKLRAPPKPPGRCRDCGEPMKLSASRCRLGAPSRGSRCAGRDVRSSFRRTARRPAPRPPSPSAAQRRSRSSRARRRHRCLLRKRTEAHHLVGRRWFLVALVFRNPIPTGESPVTIASRSLATALTEARFASGLLPPSYTAGWDTAASSSTSQSECATREASRGSSMSKKWSRGDVFLNAAQARLMANAFESAPPKGNHALGNPLIAVNLNSEPWRDVTPHCRNGETRTG